MRNFYSLGAGLLTRRERWQTRPGSGVEQHSPTSPILSIPLIFTTEFREFSQHERSRAVTMLLSLGLISAEKQETGGRPRTVSRAA